MDQVEKTNYWEQTTSSFTEWLKSNAEKLGNKESTLWRYLVVGRYYHDLRKQFERVQLEYPPLLELPKHVSPEKLELLSKLRRVAPKDFFEKLLYDVLDNAITRDEIRAQWQAFRPALNGRTARGRRALIPSVNMGNEDEYKSVREAMIVNGLKAYGPSWLGAPRAKMYEVRMHIKVAQEPPKLSEKNIDTVVLYKADNSTGLEVHIVGTLASFLRHRVAEKFPSLSDYCDYLWIAAYQEGTTPIKEHKFIKNYPEHVGLIVVDDADVSVIRKASPCNKDLEKANELLKVLLLKESR